MTKMYKNDCVILDIVTTGINPKNDDIIEIGAIKIKNSRVVETFESLIFSEKKLNSRIYDMTKISEEQLKNGQDITKVLEKLLEFTKNMPIVVYDTQKTTENFLKNSFDKNLKTKFTNEFIDIHNFFKKSLPRLKNHSLEEVNKHYGNLTKQSHNSLSDCELILKCLEQYITIYNYENHMNDTI